MSDELNLVHDLAVILISAGLFTIISRALKQPLILGYIVAGFLVGPHISFFPGIISTDSVSQWSQIGIIFLLFALGLEFSFKKLLKVGSSALIMAGCQCLGMMALGIMLGQAMGWDTMESIFLGGMLSMSSTAIVIKAYDDLGMKNAPYAPTVFGTLVVQDLIAILLMVLLSTMAVSHSFSGSEMIKGIGKLLFCLILWFLVGIFVIPTLLEKAHKYVNDEILLIISIGLCFGMVEIASAAGFSAALGAFVMGSILSETIEGEKIMKMVGSLKNLFAAVFFVSVGMMLDPKIIVEHWGTILVITIATIAGISFFSTSGAMLSGKGIDNAVHSGLSLAQLGEFSFILAGLGVSLGVMRDFIYPVIIAVSVITTFTTPYLIKAADPVSRWLHRKLPHNLVERLESMNEGSQNSVVEKNEKVDIVKSQIVRVVMYGVILVAITIGARLYLGKLTTAILPDIPKTWMKAIRVTLTLAVMFPFLVGMVVDSSSTRNKMHHMLKENESNVWLFLAMSLMKMAIAMVFIFTIIASQFALNAWEAGAIVVLAVIAFFFFMRKSYHSLIMMESRFMQNLNQKEVARREAAPVTTSVKEKLAGYDVKIEAVEVSADYPLIGQKLKDQPFRRESGVNIVKIQRGSRSILIPSGNEVVFPGDRLLAVGTEAQVAAFKDLMTTSEPLESEPQSNFVVEAITLDEDSFFTGKALKDLFLRSIGCMVISVRRDGNLITGPQPEFKFASGDTVWIAGEKDAVASLE